VRIVLAKSCFGVSNKVGQQLKKHIVLSYTPTMYREYLTLMLNPARKRKF
jgi:hypothetical protein